MRNHVLVDGISAADRERAVRELTRHCGDGRLTLDELEQRIALADAASTRTELDALFRDLPGGSPEPVAAPPVAAPPVTAPPAATAPRAPAPPAPVAGPAPVRRTRGPKLPQEPHEQIIGTLLVIGGFVALFNGLILLAILCWVAPGALMKRR